MVIPSLATFAAIFTLELGCMRFFVPSKICLGRVDLSAALHVASELETQFMIIFIMSARKSGPSAVPSPAIILISYPISLVTISNYSRTPLVGPIRTQDISPLSQFHL